MVEYNPFSEEVMLDPHPVYKRLRKEAPAYYVEQYDCWALSRFEDIWNASMDAESYTTTKGTTSAHLLTKVQPVTPMLNLMDPPQHTYLRSRIRKYFMPAAVNALEPTVRRLVAECIDSFIDKGNCDAINDFAAKIAVKVACMVNGFPLEDSEMLYGLVQRFFARDPDIVGMTPDGLAAAQELFAYFADVVRERTKSGRSYDDVINTLLEAEIDGKRLAPEDLGSHLSMFLIGGAETFPKVFGSAIYWLFRHPDQRAEMVADASLIPDAFNEVLRYDMPTQFLCRTIVKEVELHGQTMRRDQVVLFLYPSANRDEREFDQPDVFDIKRRPPRILSFGHGIHSCIGLHVARMEAKVCLEAVAKHLPEYEVELDRLERLRTEFVQGFATMPIRFKPA
jgi:cytochrome P450